MRLGCNILIGTDGSRIPGDGHWRLIMFSVRQKREIADKIQNRKDFELYHELTHPRSKELIQYFKNWLEKLGVSEEAYQEYKKRLMLNEVEIM